MIQIDKIKIEKLAINADRFFVPPQLFNDLQKQEEIHPQPVPYYKFFYHLSKLLKPKLCVELGTNRGVAAACLALGNPEGTVVTIDNVQKEIYVSCKLPNIDFWIQDSMAEPKDDLQNIDILFVDTSSKGSRNKLEYDFWVNRVRAGGLIFIDDIFIVKDHKGKIKIDFMAEFWKNFDPIGEKFELNLHGDNGFGCILKG